MRYAALLHAGGFLGRDKDKIVNFPLHQDGEFHGDILGVLHVSARAMVPERV